MHSDLHQAHVPIRVKNQRGSFRAGSSTVIPRALRVLGAMAWCLPVLALLCLPWPCHAAEAPRNTQTKAVFLCNFAQFTEWPAAAFPTNDSPVVIGIMGPDPFQSLLDETVKGERAHGRRLEIQRYQAVEEIKTCHILYIGKLEKDMLMKVLDAVKTKPILTVSEFDNANLRGVMIRFVTEPHRVRFRINVEQTRASGLTISSKVLREAEIVGPDDK